MIIHAYENGAAFLPTLTVDTWRRVVRRDWKDGSRYVTAWFGDGDDISAPRVCLHMTAEQAVLLAQELVAVARKLNREQARDIERIAKNIGKDPK